MKYLHVACVAVIGFFVTCPATLYADGCRTPSSNHKAVSYAQTNVYHDNYYAQKVFAVPFVQIPATFFSVAPEIAQARINQVTAEEAAKKALRDFKEEMRAEFEKAYGQKAEALTRDPNARTAPNEVPATTDTLANLINSPFNGAKPKAGNVQGVFNSYCTKCHNQSDPLNLLDVSVFKTRKERKKILACMEHDDDAIPMPPQPKGKPAVRIPSADRNIVRDWVNEVS